MKKFEEQFTEWVDGKLSGEELKRFEAALKDRAAAEAERLDVKRLGELLREHQEQPRLSNADFFNHQLMQRISADKPREKTPEQTRILWPVSRLAWAGAVLLILSMLVAQIIIPMGPQRNPTGAEYIAQILHTESGDPSISVTAFHAEKNNVTVLWLEGMEAVPGNRPLKSKR
jgi:hypothetical protein